MIHTGYRGLIAALLVALLAVPASANVRSIRDGNDSPGRLDVKGAGHGHGERAGTLVHRIKTREPWRNGALRDNLSKIVIDFEVNGDLTRQLTIDVNEDNKLVATMRDLESDRSVGRGRVTRADRRSLRVSFGKKLLGNRVHSYRWRVTTSYQRDGHPKCDEDEHGNLPCLDRAPNKGMVRHRL